MFFTGILYGISLAQESPSFRVCGTHFCDSQGRVTIFRGFNIAANGKVPNFKPLLENTREKVQLLADIGANAVRFPFFWEAYEVMPGQFDSSYLFYYQKVIDELHSFGIQTMIDFHQDGYSRYSLGGCGKKTLI
jgi:endoglycosylceramidase